MPNARQLICLQSEGSKVCESRLRNSLPALNVYWDRNITDTAILINNIYKIILNSLRFNSSSLYISDTSQFTEKLGNIFGYLCIYNRYQTELSSLY